MRQTIFLGEYIAIINKLSGDNTKASSMELTDLYDVAILTRLLEGESMKLPKSHQNL